jgi:hypothetical protein
MMSFEYMRFASPPSSATILRSIAAGSGGHGTAAYWMTALAALACAACVA